jgi:hypothetical protein
VDFGRHDTNVLSLMTAAVNKAVLAVTKAGSPAVKRAIGRKTNPVNAVSSDDDSTSESSSSSSCYIVSLHESSRRGDHRVCRSAEDLRRNSSLPPFNARSGQSTRAGRGRMVDGGVQAATFSLWMRYNQGIHVVDYERFWIWSIIYSLVCGESCSVSTSASRRINCVVIL